MLFVPRSFDGVLALALLALVLLCAALGKADEPARWKLTLYKANGCPPCERAHHDACEPKTVFGQFADSIDLVVKNVSEDPAAAKELQKANRQRSTPTFVLTPPPGSKAPPLVVIGYSGASTVGTMKAHRDKHQAEPRPAAPVEIPVEKPAPQPTPAPPKLNPNLLGKTIAERVTERVRDDVKKELEASLPPMFEKIGQRIKADVEANIQKQIAAQLPELRKAAGVALAVVSTSTFFGGFLGGFLGARLAAR